MFNDNLFDKEKVSPLFKALWETFAEAQATFNVTNYIDETFIHEEENVINEGFFLPFTPQTGTGKTFSSNQLIFTKLYKLASLRYRFLSNALLILETIAESQLSEVKKEALQLITKLSNCELYTCCVDESFDKEKLKKKIESIVEKTKFRCKDDNFLEKLTRRYNSFIQSLNPASISFKKIVFITDTRDNVSQSYNELYDMIEKYCKTKLEIAIIKNMVVLIMSKADQAQLVGANIHSLVEFIAENAKSPEDAKAIKHKYDKFIHYHTKVNASNSNVDKYEKEQFDAAAKDIYDSIYYGIRAITAFEKETQIPLEIKQLLIELYPASQILNDQAVVSFMTTSKYLGSIVALPNRFNFTDENHCKHILLIDEVDKQHAVVRNKILSADPILLVRGVKTAAQSDVLHFQQGKDDFKGVGDIMYDAINTLQQVAKEWRTQYSFGFDQSYDGGSRAAELFRVPGSVSTMVTMSGKKKPVEVLREDGKKAKQDAYYTVSLKLADHNLSSDSIKKNLIKMELTTDSEPYSDLNDSFPKIISSLSKAYKIFLNKSVKAIKKIHQNKKETYEEQIKQLKAQKSDYEKNGKLNAGEEWIKVRKEPSLMGCLNDFTLQLNIDDSVKDDIRSRLFGSHGGSGSLIGKEQGIINHGFHSNGCSFNTILQLSDNFVDFENYSIEHSGTGWITSLVAKGTQIIAISATAKNKSQIHNFSQSCLKAVLGKRYVEFPKQRNIDIYNFYCQKRNYRAHCVNIVSKFLQYEPSTLDHYFANHEVMLMKLETAFPPPINSGNNKNSSYENDKKIKDIQKKNNYEYLINIAAQLSKMWQAIELFVAHPTNRYMLTFSTRNFGKTEKERAFFNKYLIKYLEDKYKRKIDVHFAINAEKMRSGVLKKLLTKTMKEDGRCNVKTIVMTSYASMAAGTNPDCYFHEDDKNRLVYVDDSNFKQTKETMDADCIYLARPTNMFNISDNDDSNLISTKFKIACLYNIMCLYEAHFIDALIAKRFIRKILSQYDKRTLSNMLAAAYASAENTRNTFENAEDYLASIIMLIEQAIGRIGRTPWKSKEIQVFADAALASLLAEDQRQQHELSHEYFALREEAKLVHFSGITNAVCLASSEEKLKRAAIANNKKSLQYFNTQVPKLLGDYRYEMVKGANVLKRLLDKVRNIKEPTYKKIADCIQETKDYALNADAKIALESIWDDYKTTLNNMENRVVKGISAAVPPSIVIEKLIDKLEKEVKFRKEQASIVANEWMELRDYVLKKPTISEHEAHPRYLYVHIEVPRDPANNLVAEYAYNGTPEIEYADYYEMFSVTKTPKMVSQIASELQILLKNKDVYRHFKRKEFCLEWKSNSHIINPAVFCNIYRPALAEQAVEAILVGNGFIWSQLQEGLEEKMDGIIRDNKKNKALVDVKFWSCSRVLKDNAVAKMKDTMIKTGIKNIIYINMFKTDPKQKCLYKTFNGDETSFLTADFMEVPGIMDKDTFKPLHLDEIRKFIARKI